MTEGTKRSPRLLAIFLACFVFLILFTTYKRTKADKSANHLTSVQSWTQTYWTPMRKVSIDRDPDAHRYRPQAAFNYKHDEYLVVWHNTWGNGLRFPYARRLDINGKPIGDVFALTDIVTNQVHPFVIYNGTEDVYLVIWMLDVFMNGTSYEIWGSIIPWNATAPGTAFRIGAWTDGFSYWYPSAAWNSLHNEYLVIWDTYQAGTTPDSAQSINYQRVNTNGTLGTSGVLTNGYSPKESDLVYNSAADEYFVVWARRYDDIGLNHHIYGMILNWDATIQQTAFLVDGEWEDHRNPAIATFGQYYAVALQRKVTGTGFWSINVLIYDLNGFLGANGICPTLICINPDISAHGRNGDWLVVYEMTMDYGATVGILRYRYPWVSTPGNVYLSDTNWYFRVPAVVDTGPGNLVVYTGRSSNPVEWQHIYATKIWQAASFLPLTVR
jgi:hypothetical protein